MNVISLNKRKEIMKAYRVNLIGSHDSYLLTTKQKPAFERKLKDTKGNEFVELGGDSFRISAIRSITITDVDVDSCPDYFKNQVKKEQKGEPELPAFQKLPTQWLILDLNGKILSTSVAASEIERVTNAYLALGNPEEDKNRRFIVAKCHYRKGENGREYYTNLNQIPEAMKCFPNAELPSHIVARQIYYYGVRQWEVK